MVLVGSPAISATIQRQFSGDVRSRAFGYLGGTAGQPEPGRRSLRGIEVSWK